MKNIINVAIILRNLKCLGFRDHGAGLALYSRLETI